MSVHYKFASGKESHTVTFDSLHISVADLKKAIMQQRKIGKSVDMDLRISNAQTKEVYESDSALIPKNTSVIVARVPVSEKLKKSWYGSLKSVRGIDQSLFSYPFRERHDNSATLGTNSPSHVELDKITKSSNLSTSYASEDEKIKAMMSQSTQEYDPSKYIKNKGIIGPLPSNYTCYRCGQPGHYIKQCPTNNSDVKRSTGIPRSFMIPASADQKGALLTASGEYAVPIIDHQAYKEVKKEKPPFLPNSEDKELLLTEIPDDLKCTLCFDLLQDAVLIPCCGNSYCDECVRTILLESENHQCPTCQETNVSPDTLIPNRYLRISVAKFKNDTGYSREKFSINKTDVQNGTDKQLNESESASVKVDELSVNSDELELKVESPQQSPQNDANSDVTMDEVILGSPKIKIVAKIEEEVSVTPTNDEPEDCVRTQAPVEQSIEPINEGNDSQPETPINTGSNTPLVDEPPDSYEANEEHTNEQNEVNTINTLPHYQTQPLLTMPAYLRPPRMTGQIRPIRSTLGSQQTNPGLLGRPPILPVPQPRNMFARHGMGQDGRFYGPMRDPRSFSMGMGPVPPYAYQPPMRPPAFHDPYGYMGPRTHLPSGPMHHPMGMHQSMAEAPPPGTTTMMSDSMYAYSKQDYDDYEDRVNRFTRQMNESRPTKRLKRRSASRSRSRSHSRSSKSRSSSASSSSSSSTSSRSSRFSFSSSSFSGSSRSRSYSRRSPSRGRYRKRSRSKSRYGYNRDNYRYRRSRSPQHFDPQRRHGRRANDADRDREFRNARPSRHEPNDASFRSSRRSRERNSKESKQKYSSHCSHKSSEKSRNRDKHADSTETSSKRSGKTSQKEEVDKAENITEDNNALITDEKAEFLKESSNSDVNNDAIQVKSEIEHNKEDKSIKENEVLVDAMREEDKVKRISDCDDRDKAEERMDVNESKEEREDLEKSDKKMIQESIQKQDDEKESNEKRKTKEEDTNDDDLDKSDKRKDKDKSKKHHKHHHHHHHRHRKGSDDSKPDKDKVSDESKESSKRKHRKDSKSDKVSDDKKKHKKDSKNSKGTDDQKASTNDKYDKNDKKHKKENKNGRATEESKSSYDKKHRKESKNEKGKSNEDESKASKEKKHKHKSIVVVKRSSYGSNTDTK